MLVEPRELTWLEGQTPDMSRKYLETLLYIKAVVFRLLACLDFLAKPVKTEGLEREPSGWGCWCRDPIWGTTAVKCWQIRCLASI